MVTPILETIAAELEEKLSIGKVDADAEPELVSDFQVNSIPTLILFKNGVEVARVTGAKPKAALLDFLAPHLN